MTHAPNAMRTPPPYGQNSSCRIWIVVKGIAVLVAEAVERMEVDVGVSRGWMLRSMVGFGMRDAHGCSCIEVVMMRR